MLKTVGGLSNEELAATFTEWNKGELSSFLVEISAIILGKKDDQEGKTGFLVDVVMDKTGAKGTGEAVVVCVLGAGSRVARVLFGGGGVGGGSWRRRACVCFSLLKTTPTHTQNK